MSKTTTLAKAPWAARQHQRRRWHSLKAGAVAKTGAKQAAAE